jgi:hypothetical protein
MNHRNQPRQQRSDYRGQRNRKNSPREQSDRNYGRGSGRDVERGYGQDYNREFGQNNARELSGDYGQYGQGSGRNYGQDFSQREDWNAGQDFEQNFDRNSGWDSGRNYGSSTDRDSGRNFNWGTDRNFGDRTFDQDYDQGRIRSQNADRSGQRRDQYQHGPYSGKGPKGYQRSPERLKEQVCEQLESNGYLDASEIEVEVKNCEVTLSGKVASREDKREAELCAEAVSGVKDVHNRLTVDSNMGGESQSEQRTSSARGSKSKEAG